MMQLGHTVIVAIITLSAFPTKAAVADTQTRDHPRATTSVLQVPEVPVDVFPTLWVAIPLYVTTARPDEPPPLFSHTA